MDPSTPSRLSRKKRWLFAAALFAVLWTGAELFWRMRARAALATREARVEHANAYFVEDPRLKQRLRPGRWQTPDVWGWATQPYAFQINKEGLRGPELPPSKPEPGFRILCLGGSTTFGTGSPADSLTYPALLQTALRSALPQRGIEVLNAGVPGYTTAESYLNLGRLAHLQPDLVLVLHAVNDIAFGEQFPAFYSDPDHGVRPLNALQRARHNADSFMLEALWNQLTWPRRQRVNGRSELDSAVPSAYAANLTRIAVRARELGAQTAFLSFQLRLDPTWGPATRAEVARHSCLSYEGLVVALRDLNAVAARVAQEQDALFIDLDACVPPDASFWADYVHMNPAGYALFVAALETALLPWLQER